MPRYDTAGTSAERYAAGRPGDACVTTEDTREDTLHAGRCLSGERRTGYEKHVTTHFTAFGLFG